MNQLTRITDHELLEERVYKAIRDSIVSQASPGSRIMADRLAKDLGVSRTPVQIALHRLENEGFLKTIPRRGTYVATVSLEQVGDIYSIREVLEGLAARQAVKRGTDDFFKGLVPLQARFEAFKSQSFLDLRSSYLQTDVEFHSSIVRASSNDRLIHVLGILDDIIEMMKLRSVTLPGRVEKSLTEHLQIIDALMRRDPDGAERLMRQHIVSVRRAVERAMTAVTAPEGTVRRNIRGKAHMGVATRERG